MKKLLNFCVFLLLSSSLLFASGESEQNAPTSQTLVKSQTKEQIINDNLNAIGSLYNLIDTLSINEIDDQKAFEEMVSGLVNSLGDEYSYYVPEEFAKEYQEEASGIYGGIGTYLLKKNPDNIDLEDKESYMLKIVSPFPGGPADRAGLRSNDLISHINGELVNDLTGTEASHLLRGEPNTEVTITVVRGSISFDITLKREEVEAPTTENAIINNHIGYLVISQFTEKTAQQTEKVLKSMLEKNIDSLIIDLRNNGGGVVDDATNIANLFLNGQTIVTTQYKKTLDNNIERTVSNENIIVPMNFPIVLLVNKGSASSSEILTGALKDNNRVTVIGSQTFGKGIMQQVFKFGKGYVQFTVANYLTPNGTNIHKIGIEPDILIEEHDFTEEELKVYESMMKDNIIEKFVNENQEYSEENIEKFVEKYKDKGFYEKSLSILVRNEYLYRMDYESRPKYDLVYDDYLKKAVEYLEK